MRYFHYLGVALFFGTVASFFSHMHMDEENSPLVWGPGVLAFSAIASPLIWALMSGGGSGGRVPGRVVLQSYLFPAIGVVLTTWGLLSAAGVLPLVSWDGAEQHCRSCGVSFMLGGPRGDRPHYVDWCEGCTQIPELPATLRSLTGELCGRLKALGKPSRESVNSTIQMEVRGVGTLSKPQVAYVVEAELPRCDALQIDSRRNIADTLKVRVDTASAAPETTSIRLQFTLVAPGGGTVATVERQLVLALKRRPSRQER